MSVRRDAGACVVWGSAMAQLGDFRGGVFISYRRALSTEHARRLYEMLGRKLGPSRVFFDQRDDAIPKGTAFPNEIEQALKCAHLVLIVIAPGWLENIHERANLPDVDWVLRETELTLQRYKPGSPPEFHVVLFDNAKTPRESELPESIRLLATINAFDFSAESWAENDEILSPFLNEIYARVPQETEPLNERNLNDLTTACRSFLLDHLNLLPKVGGFEALRERWGCSLADSANAARHLEEFRSCLQSLNDGRDLSRGRLSFDDIDTLRSDCVAIVAELFRLGACSIASQLGVSLDALGNYTEPAELRGAETQAFAVSYTQKKRKAQIDFGRGALKAREHFPVKNVLDQGTVVPGIKGDKESNMLKQLWAKVPEFYEQYPDGTISYPVFDADNIRSLSIRLNAMARDATSTRVTIAFQADRGNEAHDLRVWLEEMEFDVDVLVRSGRGAPCIEQAERELLSAAWACLKQIERLDSGRRINEGR